MSKVLVQLIFFYILAFVPVKILAQSPTYWQLSDVDGLPSNTVYEIIEDKSGYIYFGTAGGLCRFNGNTFVPIPATNRKSSDASNLRLDSKGNIWYSNFNHEVFWKDEKDVAQKVSEINSNNFNSQGRFKIDSNDNLYFTNNKNVFVYENKSSKVHKVSEQFFSSYSFGMMGNTQILLAGSVFYQISLGPENEVKEYQTNNKVASKPFLYFSSKESFVIPTFYELVSPPPFLKKINLNAYPFIKNVQNVCYLSNNTIWVCTSDGVVIFDQDGNLTENGYLLKGKNISFAYCDSKNNIWVSTLNEGVLMISNFEVKSFQFFTENHQVNGVTALYTTHKNLILGMQNGDIIKINKEEETKTYHLGIDRDIYLIKELSEKDMLVNMQVFNSEFTKSNSSIEFSVPKGAVLMDNMLIYTNNSGLNIYPYKFFFGPYNDSFSVSLKMEVRNEKNKVVSSSQKDFNHKIIEGRCGKMFLDSKNRIWISSSVGVFCWDYFQSTFIKYEFDFNKGASAVDFAEDSEGNIFMGIVNEGIYLWNEQGASKICAITSANIRKLNYYKDRIWIATSNGLYVLTRKENKLHHIRITDGLLSNDIQDIAIFNDKLWVATFKGINTFSYDYLPFNLHVPKTFLTSVEVNDKKIENNANLHYNENSLLFKFEAIEYKSRNLLTYKYRLRGLSDKWVDISGNTSQVLFQGLKAGQYVFELKSFNDKGVGAENPLLFSFQITEPIWRKSWFWTILAVCLLVLVVLYWRKYVMDKNKKLQLENELRLSQLNSLKAQMNPHFIFNALNSIQDFILLNDKKNANVFLGKFSDLMRLILQMSSKPTIPLSTELKAINLYLELESLRFEDTFTYKIDISPSIEPADWEVPSMIIQPFVENAIKHGLLHKRSDRKLYIKFSTNPSMTLLEVEIEDNGIGRKAAEKINLTKTNRHESFATGATEKRLKLLNQNITSSIEIEYDDLIDKQGISSGTKVKIKIPLTKRNSPI